MERAIPFAINSKGVEILPEQANKSDSDYKCPDCNEHVLFCHGKVRVPYFRHQVENVHCGGGGEGALHRLGKVLFRHHLSKWVILRNCATCNTSFVSKTRFSTHNLAKFEIPVCNNGYRVDVLVDDSTVVEICNKHAVDEDKLKALQAIYKEKVFEFNASAIKEAHDEKKQYRLRDKLPSLELCGKCQTRVNDVTSKVWNAVVICRSRDTKCKGDIYIEWQVQWNIIKKAFDFGELGMFALDCVKKTDYSTLSIDRQKSGYCEVCTAEVKKEEDARLKKVQDKIQFLTSRSWNVEAKCSRDRCRGMSYYLLPGRVLGLEKIDLKTLGKYGIDEIAITNGKTLTITRVGHLCENCVQAKRMRPCMDCKKWLDKDEVYEQPRQGWGQRQTWKCEWCQEQICNVCKNNQPNCEACKKAAKDLFTKSETFGVDIWGMCKRCGHKTFIKEQPFDWGQHKHLLRPNFRKGSSLLVSQPIDSCKECTCSKCPNRRNPRYGYLCDNCEKTEKMRRCMDCGKWLFKINMVKQPGKEEVWKCQPCRDANCRVCKDGPPNCKACEQAAKQCFDGVDTFGMCKRCGQKTLIRVELFDWAHHKHLLRPNFRTWPSLFVCQAIDSCRECTCSNCPNRRVLRSLYCQECRLKSSSGIEYFMGVQPAKKRKIMNL